MSDKTYGKGSKDRVKNIKKFKDNYDEINWGKSESIKIEFTEEEKEQISRNMLGVPGNIRYN